MCLRYSGLKSIIVARPPSGPLSVISSFSASIRSIERRNPLVAAELLNQQWLSADQVRLAAEHPTSLRTLSNEQFTRLEQHGYESIRWNEILFGSSAQFSWGHLETTFTLPPQPNCWQSGNSAALLPFSRSEKPIAIEMDEMTSRLGEPHRGFPSDMRRVPFEFRPVRKSTDIHKTGGAFLKHLFELHDALRRGRLDECARARSSVSQAPSGAGPRRSSGGTASLAASEQHQERGRGTSGGSVIIWPIGSKIFPVQHFDRRRLRSVRVRIRITILFSPLPCPPARVS
jgi:hypothetical protein